MESLESVSVNHERRARGKWIENKENQENDESWSKHKKLISPRGCDLQFIEGNFTHIIISSMSLGNSNNQFTDFNDGCDKIYSTHL